MMNRHLLRYALVPVFVAIVLATAGTVNAQTNSSQASVSSSQKLDHTLQMAVERTPDVAQVIVVRTSADSRDSKVKALAQAGFTVKGARSDREILVEATAREATVLAEDQDIELLSVK